MSLRTLVELNHDYCPEPSSPDALLEWAMKMAEYMRTGNMRNLPDGVTFKHVRHHSAPDPMNAGDGPSDAIGRYRDFGCKETWIKDIDDSKPNWCVGRLWSNKEKRWHSKRQRVYPERFLSPFKPTFAC